MSGICFKVMGGGSGECWEWVRAESQEGLEWATAQLAGVHLGLSTSGHV